MEEVWWITEGREAAGEGGGDLSGKGLHGRHIDNLEIMLLDYALPHVGADLAQHRDHGNVGLSGAGGRAHEQVLIAAEGGWVDAALDAVQLPAGRQGLFPAISAVQDNCSLTIMERIWRLDTIN